MPAYHKAIMVDLLCASAIHTKVLKKKEKQRECIGKPAVLPSRRKEGAQSQSNNGLRNLLRVFLAALFSPSLR
jgi:hypothetical protein